MFTPVGVSNAEGPPVPIPNTEVKLCCAHNTCLATDREDRSMPTSVSKNVKNSLADAKELFCFKVDRTINHSEANSPIIINRARIEGLFPFTLALSFYISVMKLYLFSVKHWYAYCEKHDGNSYSNNK